MKLLLVASSQLLCGSQPSPRRPPAPAVCPLSHGRTHTENVLFPLNTPGNACLNRHEGIVVILRWAGPSSSKAAVRDPQRAYSVDSPAPLKTEMTLLCSLRIYLQIYWFWSFVIWSCFYSEGLEHFLRVRKWVWLSQGLLPIPYSPGQVIGGAQSFCFRVLSSPGVFSVWLAAGEDYGEGGFIITQHHTFVHISLAGM